LSTILLLLCAAILFFNVWRTVATGFIQWPAALETRIRYQTVWQEVARQQDIARHWASEAAAAPVLAEVFFEPIDADSFRRILGRPVDARWIQTGAGLAGALVWPAEEPTPNVYVPEYAPLDPRLLELAGVSTEPLYRSRSSPSFAVYTLPPEPATVLEPSGARFDERLTLLGYAVLPVEAGGLSAVSYWRVDQPLPADLSLFMHLLDERGEITSQHDGLDAAAATLLPGDRLLQYHILPLPPETDLAEPPHTMRLGAYRRSDGRRLAITNCMQLPTPCLANALDALPLPWRFAP
jgi:hypothetical protein